MKTIDCSREVALTPKEIVEACDKMSYNRMGYLYNEEMAEKWLARNPFMAICPDLKFAANSFISTLAIS